MNQSIVDYTYLQNTTWRLKAAYPMLRVVTVGKSVVGRSIYALELGDPSRETVVYFGTFLGTDGISGQILLRWMERLLKAVAEGGSVGGTAAANLLRGQSLAVIPFVNPDGREICARGSHCGGVDSGRIRRLCGGHTDTWDANARGVEIPRNFDHRFSARRARQHDRGVFGPCAKGYGGPSPESEPETVAVVTYCRTRPIRRAVALYPGRGGVFWRGGAPDPAGIESLAARMACTAGIPVEAAVGVEAYTGFRNWFQDEMERPAIDVMIHRTAGETPRDAYPALEELLTVSCFG